MPHIDEILSQPRLDALRTGYDAGKSAMDGILRDTLPQVYELSQEYVDAILDIFYGPLPPDTTTSRAELSAPDRERCIIALLAARGSGFNLALHIYLGLMQRLSAQEIAHILLLAGVYTGVDNFTGALAVEMKTLGELVKAPATDPVTVYKALRAAFPG